MELQSNLRAGSLIVLSELRELSAVPGGSGAQNDILVAGPTALVYRAMRGIGFICGTPSATSHSNGSRELHRSTRPPGGRGRGPACLSRTVQPREPKTSGWALKIVSVATGASCPGALGPGITLTVPASPAVAGLEAGTPVRITEVMELRLYESEGRSWLGARSVSSGEAIQPLVGPLTTGSGFRLEYLDAAGSPTADRTSIKSIRVALRGTTQGTARETGRRWKKSSSRRWRYATRSGP